MLQQSLYQTADATLYSSDYLVMLAIILALIIYFLGIFAYLSLHKFQTNYGNPKQIKNIFAVCLTLLCLLMAPFWGFFNTYIITSNSSIISSSWSLKNNAKKYSFDQVKVGISQQNTKNNFDKAYTAYFIFNDGKKIDSISNDKVIINFLLNKNGNEMSKIADNPTSTESQLIEKYLQLY